MSTSFPNSNGNVPPYNSQTNGSFNQFGQGGPQGYPGMEQFHHHNMYAPSANGYGGMPPGQPNMGGPAQQNGPPQKTQQPPQQYPGPGTGVKLPGYDSNSMQNGYMGYPPLHPQRPTVHPQNGPPPNYNAHQQMPSANSQYGGVPDPYRMYGMQGPPTQLPNAQNPSSQQRPPSQNANQSRTVSSQNAPQQYPTQQPLPAHLHNASSYNGMQPPNVPLQHYQAPHYGNGTPPVRGPPSTGFPPLQLSKQSKPDDSRPNNLTGPNAQYPGNYGGAGPSSGFDSYGSAPGGYPGYGSVMGTSGSLGTPGNSGVPGSSTSGSGQFGYNAGPFAMSGQNQSGHNTPGQNTPGQNTPCLNTPGHNTPGQNTPGQNTTGQNTPSASSGSNGNPFGGMTNQGNQGQFASNELSGHPGPSGGYGTMNCNIPTPGSQNERATPGTPSTPGTPGSHAPMGSSNQTPLCHQKMSHQQHQSGMQSQMPPPHYNPNNIISPNQGASGSNAQKHPGSSPMGSSLPSLNGQYQPMFQNMQSPSMEPTFKEPAMPIRHSPSHMQSPVHPQPSGAPPAYNAPSSSRTPDSTNNSQPQRSHSPTFAVPTLPAAATLALASSANQVSTKPRTSPHKKRGEDGLPEPPTQETPFTTVTHYELPAAMTVLKDTLSVGSNEKVHPNVEKQYFNRKRQQLRVPYPEGVNAHSAAINEPDTFGFMQGNKYFNPKYCRAFPSQPSSMGPPLLSRSQSMHGSMISPGFNTSQPSTSGRQPAKKARSASDASEPPFNVPLPPSRGHAGPPDPRHMQQMQMQQQFQQQMHMQKMQQQQQQMAAHQHHMTRMGPSSAGPSSAGPAGISPGPSQLPPLSAPSLQRADSMPQLPTQQQPPMGGPMASHMGGMSQINGNLAEGLTGSNSTGLHSNNVTGLPPLSLRSQVQGGTQNHEFPSGVPSTSSSNQSEVLCAGCHHFILPGSPTLCCMYHDCKNVYHRECTRLSPSAFIHFEGTPQARWVCPSCEIQVRPMQIPQA